MRRLVLIILTLFLFFTNTIVDAKQDYIEKEFVTIAKDGFTINSTFKYPKNKNQKEFKTVVLLHSLGYNSQWWCDLEVNLLERGYAVLAIDLRGHGKSVYNSRLIKTSWKNLKKTAFSKYPDDILEVINTIKEENSKKIFFDNWAIIGADIGASSGIIASDRVDIKPKTIVMISPAVNAKGLYIPISIAHLDNVDILAISGTGDTDSKEAAKYLRKFAQAQFLEFTSESKTTGMMMLKNDPGLSKMLTEWVSEYLN